MRLFVVGAVAIGLLSAAPRQAHARQAPAAALSHVAVERTERMLENRLACLGCHRIGDQGGRIGPSLNAISERADAAYVLAVIGDPAASIPGTLMPHQRLRDADISRLTTYLMSLPAQAADAAGAASAPPVLEVEDRLNGSALYARYCAACHGESGRGEGWNADNLPVIPTPHADAELMSTRADDTLFDAIYAGGFVLDRSARMPAFGAMLDREQIRALVTHIRTLCDCSQPAWAGGS
jgi:mono/diheme cytochrome c family protein